MSIISVREMGERRTSSEEESGERKYTRIFLVITDDARVDSLTVRDAAGIPAMFDPYLIPAYFDDTGAGQAFVSDPKALVKDKTPRETPDNPFRWEVDVNYSSRARRPSLGVEDPLLRPATYKWTTETTRLPIQQDLDGQDPTNSAGDPFDPPLEYDVAQRVLTITRNEANFDPGALDQYSFSSNQESFFGYDQGAARMEPINGDEHFEADESYWVITYIIKFRNRPGIPPLLQWRLKPMDRGLRYVDAGGERKGIEDGFGRAISMACPMDGTGHALDLETDNIVYLDFRVYPYVDWTPLDLLADYPG